MLGMAFRVQSTAEFSISGSVGSREALPGLFDMDSSILTKSPRAAGYSLQTADLLSNE